MEKKLEILTRKKQELDKHQPLPLELVKNLEEWLMVELTYSSNAIEGNILTRLETAEVIEKGLKRKGLRRRIRSFDQHLKVI